MDTVTDATPTATVLLRSGDVLTAAVAYDCRGNGASNAAPLFSSSEHMKAALDDKGKVVVDESLRRKWPGRPPVAAYCCGSVLRGKLATPDGSAVVEVPEALRGGESFEDLGRRVGRALVEQGGSEFLSGY